ncbi:DNA-binding LytR/AlgR family response regulator [Algoriphagus iocasae]|uniref:DNA-binding LytR/AlgR family response regulator n=1 Tax=Algoriphagus iocasae TaxID=1836499 RepID=A0A841MEP6_9BACT|nr:LytTR family DNA-binding domain-containing protein [Algoriphagus iocasae]MBB6325243.1 DNA-binding LytR/AlgR family response regulator [Algoriphagus iocasae]
MIDYQMNFLLISDESQLSQKIEVLLQEKYLGWKILKIIKAVEDFENYSNQVSAVDFIVVDFDLISSWENNLIVQFLKEKPLIFISNRKEKAMEAFEFDCLDFLLKPVLPKKLEKAFEKMSRMLSLNSLQNMENQMFENIVSRIAKSEFKKRFLVKIGNRFTYVPTEKVSFFFSENGVTYLVESGTAQKYIVENSLNELQESLLNPTDFYRINRSMIINLHDVSAIKPYVNGRLLLSLATKSDFEPIVARERVAEFKRWVNQ